MMAKSNEKEPLLFIDTTYKGCFVKEQSFFKTPTPKPQNISIDNYVHNFDDLGESHFQSLVPPDEKGQMVNSNSHQVEEEIVKEEVPVDEMLYETVNIIVDVDPTSHDVSGEDHSSVSSTFVEVEPEAEPEVVEAEEVILEDNTLISEVKEENLDIDIVEADVTDSHEESNEESEEILRFIQDLTHRPAMMKAPVVQIVKKDGSSVSGMIERAGEHHITVDDMRENPQVIAISEIEGIRILQL